MNRVHENVGSEFDQPSFSDVIRPMGFKERDRLADVIDFVLSAAGSIPGQADDVDYEAGVVTVELEGYGPTALAS